MDKINPDDTSVTKRLESIRSLPKGQFSRYKQMFDALMKIKDKKKEKQPEQSNTSSNTSLSSSRSTKSSSPTTSLSKIDEKHMLVAEEDNKIIIGLESSNLQNSASNNESSSHVEIDSPKTMSSLAAVFYGVSDDTNSILNSLISGNEQIAQFFDKPSVNLHKNSDNIKGEFYSSVCSTSSISSLTPSSKSSNSKKDWYKPVSLERGARNTYLKADCDKSKVVNIDKTNLTDSSNSNSAVTTLSSLKSSINSYSDSMSIANFESKLNTIFLEMNTDEKKLEYSNDECSNKNENEIATHGCENRVSPANAANSTNLIATKKTATNSVACESIYFEMDEFEFSDESYETESNEYDDESFDKFNEPNSFLNESSANNADKSKKAPPPPKPKRTFEHDVYVNLKEENKNEVTYSTNINKNRISRNNKAKSLFNENAIRINEHLYETLPSVNEYAQIVDINNNNNNNNNNEINKNNNEILNNLSKKLNKKFTSNLNISNKTSKNDALMKKFRLNNIKSTKNMNMKTLSEPNLTQIGSPPIKNEKQHLTTIDRLFNTIKKTLSRKTLNEENEIFDASSIKSSNSSRSSSKDDKKNPLTSKIQDKSVVFRKTNTNTLMDRMMTRSHIYSDLNESNLKLVSLFDYVLIVDLSLSKSYSTDGLDTNDCIEKLKPTIQWKFPIDIPNLNSAIPEFCFPDASCQFEYKKNENEIFQFTLTNIDGKRTYGYCIRLISKNKNPVVICIISRIEALEMYFTILTEAEKMYSTSLDDIKLFLTAIYSKPLPSRGESIIVSFGIKNKKELTLNRSIDRRLEHISLHAILNYPFDLIIKIFTAMLIEKQIIFLSSKLSLLSITIQAFETLLYPFNWPHTYIPVLPTYLSEMCESPTPYIIGLMRTCKNELLQKYKDVHDMIIIDLDKQKCILDNDNDVHVLPDSVIKTLKLDLYNLMQVSKFSSKYEKNVELCRIFLKIFLKTIGNYKDFIFPVDNSYSNDEEKLKFLYQDFVNQAASSELKSFLEIFTKTQLFEVFVTKKLTPNLKFGLMFDQAIRDDLTQNVLNLAKLTATSPKLKKIKQLKNRDKTKKLRF